MSNSDTHHFLVEEAVKYGMAKAVLLQNIRFWLKKNKANNANIKNGFYWTYNSTRAFNKLFPYMSRSGISKSLNELCECGVLKKGNFNRDSRDTTLWYTIPDEFGTEEVDSGEDVGERE